MKGKFRRIECVKNLWQHIVIFLISNWVCIKIGEFLLRCYRIQDGALILWTWSFLGLRMVQSMKYWLLQFSSWIALFSSSLLFVPHLLSQGPFPMLTIIIFLSWDPSHSPYALSNPYTIPYTTTGQGTLFAYLFLVMDDYSFSRFSCICCMLLLLILFSMTFHSYSVEHST